MLLTEFFDNFQETKKINEMAEELSDIVTARELIGQAVRNPQQNKHKYFEYLKYLRSKYGAEYSTRVHQKAAELAVVKDQN
jgi:hypothetical protein